MISVQPEQEGIILNGACHILTPNAFSAIACCNQCSLREPCFRLGKNYCSALRDMTFHFESVNLSDSKW